MLHPLIMAALAEAADAPSGFSGSAATFVVVAPKFGGDTTAGHAHLLSLAHFEGPVRVGLDLIATDLHLTGYAATDREGTDFFVERLDLAGHLFVGTRVGAWFIDGLLGADWKTGWEFGVHGGYLPWTLGDGAFRVGPDALLLVQIANLDVRLSPVIALGLRVELSPAAER